MTLIDLKHRVEAYAKTTLIGPGQKVYTSDALADDFRLSFIQDAIVPGLRRLPVITWYDTTDTVGLYALLLNNVFVALQYQQGRKCPMETVFVTKSTSHAVERAFRAMMEYADTEIVNSADAEKQLDDIIPIFTNQKLTHHFQ